jgi:hypothetical protein
MHPSLCKHIPVALWLASYASERDAAASAFAEPMAHGTLTMTFLLGLMAMLKLGYEFSDYMLEFIYND